MLKMSLDSLEAVDEPMRALYEEREGKFVLKVEGIEDSPQAASLKRALETERKTRGDLEKKVKKWEALGKSEEEIAELLTTAERAEHEKAEKSGDLQKILAQHQAKWAKEKEALETELGAARASELNAIIGTSITVALTSAKATAEGLDLLPERIGKRIVFETVDGKRVLKIMAADGETPMAGTGANGLATVDDLVRESREKYPSLFKGDGISGTGKQATDRSGANADLLKLSPVDRINAARARR